jgi:hypothetical protein
MLTADIVQFNFDSIIMGSNLELNGSQDSLKAF